MDGNETINEFGLHAGERSECDFPEARWADVSGPETIVMRGRFGVFRACKETSVK